MREQVAEASRRCAAAGLLIGTAGNISARVGEYIAVTATGVVLAEATAEQVSVVDLDGNVVDGSVF